MGGVCHGHELGYWTMKANAHGSIGENATCTIEFCSATSPRFIKMSLVSIHGKFNVELYSGPTEISEGNMSWAALSILSML
jgi:hypothetical protein